MVKCLTLIQLHVRVGLRYSTLLHPISSCEEARVIDGPISVGWDLK